MRSRQTIRIFSWNINGIAPYLPLQSTAIASFFKSSADPNKRPATNDNNTSTQPGSDNLRTFLSRHNWPAALFLQELKIQQGNDKALAALLASLNSPLNGDDTLSDSRTYTLDGVLPRDKYNARGFQGRLYGVGTILRTDFVRRHVARVREVDWDLEGRVSIVELKPPPPEASTTTTTTTTTTTDSNNNNNNNNLVPATTVLEQGQEEDERHRAAHQNKKQKKQPLALINVYAVNGSAAPYRCPKTGAVAGTRHDRKLAFHAALRDECLALERRGFRVVVAGDLNVARGPPDGHPSLRVFPRQHCANRADFNAKFFAPEENRRAGAYVAAAEEQEEGEQEQEPFFDGVDVFRALHGLERQYTYYPRTRAWGSSSDRVDMIIVSRRLWDEGRVRATGILDTPQERGRSDHVPLWVEVVV
ncbi:Endonuclease/exonuclease/phosphatase [Thermothelomyces heterothallicus CBS 202.75]|uniref:Endonuclease/exonuclease/phosphatase n=1 Tax=Thermothelomyces heterothallicus CBS 202.75 TaxID=1149848 RepID=UPI003743F792